MISAATTQHASCPPHDAVWNSLQYRPPFTHTMSKLESARVRHSTHISFRIRMVRMEKGTFMVSHHRLGAHANDYASISAATGFVCEADNEADTIYFLSPIATLSTLATQQQTGSACRIRACPICMQWLTAPPKLKMCCHCIFPYTASGFSKTQMPGKAGHSRHVSTRVTGERANPCSCTIVQSGRVSAHGRHVIGALWPIACAAVSM